jgi:hypothetical protein
MYQSKSAEALHNLVYKPFVPNNTKLKYNIIKNHKLWSSISNIIQNLQTIDPPHGSQLLLIVINLNDDHTTRSKID